MIWRILCVSVLHFMCVFGCDVEMKLTGREVPVPQDNHNNFVYYAHIGMGTPAQPFRVTFDTGSVDLILINKDFSNIAQSQYQPNTFDYRQSSTYEPLNIDGDPNFKTEYGRGMRSGKLALDVMTIGDGNQKIQVKTMFGLADEIEEYNPEESDAVFGLGFTMGSHLKNPIISPLETIISQAEVCGAVSYFAERIVEDRSVRDYFASHSGELYFGGFNKKYVDEQHPIITAKVKPKKRMDSMFFTAWDIQMEGMYVGDEKLGYFTQLLPDSGTSRIGIPEHLLEQLTQLIFKENRGSFPADILTRKNVYPCRLLPDNLPNLSFKIIDKNGRLQNLVLEPKDYIFSIEKDLLCHSRFNEVVEAESQKIDEGDGQKKILLGLPFFQKYYTSFDFQNKEVSFAVAKQDKVTVPIQPGLAGKQAYANLHPMNKKQFDEMYGSSF
ncbi:lysosomal aspartic protease-like [Macrosteles quadrilineatus]|uniref:lysosomal aspartic protease-like n=1 Tax=Macrosteles quadrilineatus TaxID=74068 RepID=UPI0023E1274C|nr:lysosomal aspartic protease-like [Macrosteles quadrilineatus]